MTNVKKLQFISLLTGMYFYTPIMTLFLLEKDIALSLLVMAQIAFSITMMLAELPTGIFADKFGQITAMRIGIALDAFGMIQLLFIHNTLGLVLFFAVRGLSVAFKSGSDEALLYESYVHEEGSAEGYPKSYSAYLSNDIIGFIVATALSGFAVQFFGAKAFVPLIVLTGLVTFFALGITFTLKRFRYFAQEKKVFELKSHIKKSFSVIKDSRAIIALTIMGILTLNGEYFLRQSYQPFFEGLMVPALFLGLALALGKTLNFVLMRYSYLLEKFLTIDQIIFSLNLLLGTTFVALSFVQSSWAIVVLFILLQGFFNLERPIVSDYINQRIPSHERSTVLSSISLVKSVGRIGADIALAGVVGLLGIGLTYMIQGAYLLIGMIIAVWYMRRCKCVQKVKPDSSDIQELSAMQEVA